MRPLIAAVLIGIFAAGPVALASTYTQGDSNTGSTSGTNTGDVTLTTVGSTPSANGASLSGQQLRLQPADATHPGALLAADWVTFNAKQAAISFAAVGSTPNANGGTLSAGTLTLQPADATHPGVMTAAQAVLLAAQSGTNTGDVTLGAVGSSPSANGASLSGQVLTLQPVDATHPGVVTTGTQTIAGAKTWSNAGTFSAGLNMPTGNTVSFNAGGTTTIGDSSGAMRFDVVSGKTFNLKVGGTDIIATQSDTDVAIGTLGTTTFNSIQTANGAIFASGGSGNGLGFTGAVSDAAGNSVAAFGNNPTMTRGEDRYLLTLKRGTTAATTAVGGFFTDGTYSMGAPNDGTSARRYGYFHDTDATGTSFSQAGLAGGTTSIGTSLITSAASSADSRAYIGFQTKSSTPASGDFAGFAWGPNNTNSFFMGYGPKACVLLRTDSTITSERIWQAISDSTTNMAAVAVAASGSSTVHFGAVGYEAGVNSGKWMVCSGDGASYSCSNLTVGGADTCPAVAVSTDYWVCVDMSTSGTIAGYVWPTTPEGTPCYAAKTSNAPASTTAGVVSTAVTTTTSAQRLFKVARGSLTMN